MEKVTYLEKLIRRYATSYYQGNAEVSDEYFDNLVDDLRSIDPDNKLLSTPGWGYSPKEKVDHWYGLEVGSLTKYKEENGVSSIPDKFKTADTRVSAKLDGLSVVSYFVNGKLIQALTRGNGKQGIDVTQKLIKILGTTKLENDDRFTGAVRGEVVMPMSVWNSSKYDLVRQDPSSNPRNIASGLLNRNEVSENLTDLEYVVYKILYSETPLTNRFDTNDILINNFDRVVPYRFNADSSKYKEYYDEFCKFYPCDGLVLSNFKVNQNSSYVDVEEIALKFEAESKEVVVTDVTYEPTRTGRMAPRIWFDPIELSGAVVRKCTGFNAQFIKDNGVGIGARIVVARSNEVIPDIQSVIDPVEPKLPEVCPNCGEPLKWVGVDLVCENENESQLPYHFMTWVASVDGAGWSLYNSIIEVFDLKDSVDLAKFIISLDDNGVDQAIDFIRKDGRISGEVTISKCKEIFTKLVGLMDPVCFICACNIKGVSWTTAKTIMDNYPKFLEDLSKEPYLSVPYKLQSIKGIGWSTVESIIKNSERVRTLLRSVKLNEYVKEVKEDTKFKVAITGALSMKRADFDKKLNEYGIEQSGNFNEIKYLITNNPDSGSSKMNKAKEKGIEIISEEEFVKKYFN